MPNPEAADVTNQENLGELLKALDVYEAFAFEHESDFLDKVVNKGKPTDLAGLSFNNSGITAHWVDISGQHLMGKIELARFMDWFSATKKASA